MRNYGDFWGQMVNYVNDFTPSPHDLVPISPQKSPKVVINPPPPVEICLDNDPEDGCVYVIFGDSAGIDARLSAHYHYIKIILSCHYEFSIYLVVLPLLLTTRLPEITKLRLTTSSASAKQGCSSSFRYRQN